MGWKIPYFMKKLILLLGFILFISFPQPVKAQDMAGESAVLTNKVLGIKMPDSRVDKLEKFLDSYNSPLTPYAACFIETADKYQIDWRLVPAITGVESTFGKRIPANSFNAYGWNNGNYRFGSWEESIEKVSLTLKEKYVNRGLDNPYKIGPVYAPPSKTWAGKVASFMRQIDTTLDLTI